MARPRSNIAPRIVRSARRRFLEDGVDGASLRTIASDAGTSIGMVYYYYPTKDDLFFAVVEEIYIKLLADMTEALEPNAPAQERLRRLYHRVGTLSEIELTTLRLILREVLVSSTRLNRLIERFQRGHIPLVIATLTDGIAEGSIDSKWSPALLFSATLAMGAVPQIVNRIAGSRLRMAIGRPPAEFADELIEALFGGIGTASDTRLPSAPGSSTATAHAPVKISKKGSAPV